MIHTDGIISLIIYLPSSSLEFYGKSHIKAFTATNHSQKFDINPSKMEATSLKSYNKLCTCSKKVIMFVRFLKKINPVKAFNVTYQSQKFEGNLS